MCWFLDGQVLSPSFLRGYKKDIINIHHGLLPSFKGANPYRQVRWGVSLSRIRVFDSTVTKKLPENAGLWSWGEINWRYKPFCNWRTRRWSHHRTNGKLKAFASKCYYFLVLYITTSAFWPLFFSFFFNTTSNIPLFLLIIWRWQVDRVSHRDSLHTFATRSENLEKQCLGNAIKYYCEQRILRYSTNKTIVFG